MMEGRDADDDDDDNNDSRSNKEGRESHSFAARIRRVVYSKGLLSIRCHVEPSV